MKLENSVTMHFGSPISNSTTFRHSYSLYQTSIVLTVVKSSSDSAFKHTLLSLSSQSNSACELCQRSVLFPSVNHCWLFMDTRSKTLVMNLHLVKYTPMLLLSSHQFATLDPYVHFQSQKKSCPLHLGLI